MTEAVRIAGLLVMVLVLGCSGGTEVGNPTASGVVAFDSSEALESYLKEQLASTVVPRNVADAAAMEGDFQAGSYSTTNLQEASADESDTVKNDGEHLYIARQGEVAVVQAMPAGNARVVSRVPIDGTVDSLYLSDNLLIVFAVPAGSAWSQHPDDRITVGMPSWIPDTARTCVLIYDVTDPASPTKRREVEIEGVLASSRIVGGRLHVVQQFLPVLPALDSEYNGTQGDLSNAVSGNAGALDDLTLDDLIPSYTVVDGQGERSPEEPLVTYRDFYRPTDPEGGSIVTITTFDLEDVALPFSSVGFVGDVHTVYASTDALFLLSNSYVENGSTWSCRTLIHRFSLDDLSDIASGTVEGWIVNQFSLGEYNGVLRIATTDSLNDPPGVTNTVFCLRQNGTGLEVAGRIDDITPGERIYSARFIEDRGYLVTFVQVDPLITLDLSDPERPAILGELVLPGYSTYIHPVDDDTLITLGVNTVEHEGMVVSDGVQLSLFDVSEPEVPVLVDRVTIGDSGTSSEALWNHKAFTFLPDVGLIAFPIDIYETSAGDDWWSMGGYTFSGLYVYRMDGSSGFTFLGRIDTQPGEDWFYSTWTRGVFMGDSVHAVRADEVKSAYVNDIGHTISTLSLE